MRSFSPFRHIGSIFWKRNPIHLTFFVTRRCNARCPYCFYLSNGSKSEGDELSIYEIERISSSMGKLLWLAFSGGEIFLREDIVDIVRIFYDRNKPVIILFSTNGLLPQIIEKRIEEILKYCNRSTIVVKLSLDGPAEIHDSIRRTKDGFKKTLQTYKVLGEMIDKYPNLELGINTVFCSFNQAYMGDLIDFVNSLEKIKTHTVSLIRGDIQKEIDPERYRETINRLESDLKAGASSIYRFRGARLKAAQDILQRSLIYQTLIHKRRLIPCYAGRLNIVLTESGDVYPCESFNMRLGNIRDNKYNLKGLLRTIDARRVISSIQDGKCYCTHECYMMTNILFNPFMYPALIRHYLKIPCH